MHLSAFCVALVLCCMSAACGNTARAASDDQTLTTRVHVQLLSEPSLRSPEQIQVKTFDGVVTLSGRVSSKELEEKAIALAKSVRGVKEVRSTLKIE